MKYFTRGQTIIIICVVILLVAFLTWVEKNYYINPKTIPFEVKVENIEIIFYHENFRFTYMVRNESGVIEPVILTYSWEEGAKLVIYDDVPAGKLMWAVIQGKGNPKDGTVTDIEIHVHSIKDLKGGSWNHGKFGSGNTIVVE